MKNILFIITFILSFLGYMDSSYLTILHYKNAFPPCSVTHGCETVLTSKYAMLGPIPVALLGVLYFVVLLVMIGLLFERKRKIILQGITILVISAFIISVGLVFIQAFVLHAFCQYCLGVEGINTIILGIIVWHSKNKTANY